MDLIPKASKDFVCEAIEQKHRKKEYMLKLNPSFANDEIFNSIFSVIMNIELLEDLKLTNPQLFDSNDSNNLEDLVD